MYCIQCKQCIQQRIQWTIKLLNSSIEIHSEAYLKMRLKTSGIDKRLGDHITFPTIFQNVIEDFNKKCWKNHFI